MLNQVHPIITNLLLLRSRLASKRFDEKDKFHIELTREMIIQSNSLFKEILLNAINNSLEDASHENLKAAYNEINFVHNLPITEEELARWNARYFYMTELIGYIQRVIEFHKDYKRIIKIVSLLAKAQERISALELSE